ncbi:MAG TPA: 2-oxoglutarate dehydrogenase complex dihydrolipoyllysine-residue succinyltransferase [Anaeromyxobacteraceae bacterium]|nr:2-oxoglutarate dehydrogenase complex dihydrolipoyllysine-residue succinyltransferase [Anaeromyxobacteraceae bacterium]
MAIELRVPALGESITQATVGAWLKKEGDAVAADEPVVEVESEKATVALPAPAAGVLRRIVKPQGSSVAVGEVIGELEAGAGAVAVPAAKATASSSTTPSSSPSSSSTSPPSSSMPYGPIAAGAGSEVLGGNGQPLRAPPSVRRLIAEKGLDAAQLGAGGVVRRADVERAVEARGAPAAPIQAPGGNGAAPRPPGDRERLVPMSPLRRTVARRLLEAQQNAAILTTFNEIDMSRVLALREKHGDTFLKAHGVKLGFTSFFVKASVEALRAWPAVNAEVRGQDIVYKDHYDVGVAVGGGKGLVVPVLRDCDRLSFAEIEKTTAELAKRARENRITMQDLEGGTFTISNGGIYGSLLSTPILNPPQSGILGLHKIEKRPVAGPNDAVVVRPMMYVALSYDHRLIDGREAVSFLVRVKECIEDPERILFEA